MQGGHYGPREPLRTRHRLILTQVIVERVPAGRLAFYSWVYARLSLPSGANQFGDRALR